NAAEQFVRAQVERRQRQTSVAVVQETATQCPEPLHGPADQVPDDYHPGRVVPEGVEVALNGGGGVFLTHRRAPVPQPTKPRFIITRLHPQASVFPVPCSIVEYETACAEQAPPRLKNAVHLCALSPDEGVEATLVRGAVPSRL